MNAERSMERIIQLYLSGKLETEISDILQINENEVKYILSEKNKTNVENVYGNAKYREIVKQRMTNKKALRQALKSDFSSMNRDELLQIINSFTLSRMDIQTYCETYDIPEDIFTVYLLNLSFLKSKLGDKLGTQIFNDLLSNIQEIHVLENISVLGTDDLNYKRMLFKLGPLYLDSLYKPKEFMEHVKINEQIFALLFQNKEAIQRVAKGNLYERFVKHTEKVAKIRKYGTLPEGHNWIKDANIRRVILPGIESMEKSKLESLYILVSFYENNGNIEMVKKEQKKPRPKILNTLTQLHVFDSILQPQVYEQIKKLSEHQPTISEGPMRVTGMKYQKKTPHIFTTKDILYENQVSVDYKEVVETKKKWLQSIANSSEIRPYWLCGMLAIYNFSASELSRFIGVPEAEIMLANQMYMSSICKTSDGQVLPFQYSFEILQYAAALKPKNIKHSKKA